MDISLLDRLADPKFQKKLKNINLAGNQKYWDEQNEMMKKMEEKHQQERKSIEMSHEKCTTPFTI